MWNAQKQSSQHLVPIACRVAIYRVIVANWDDTEMCWASNWKTMFLSNSIFHGIRSHLVPSPSLYRSSSEIGRHPENSIQNLECIVCVILNSILLSGTARRVRVRVCACVFCVAALLSFVYLFIVWCKMIFKALELICRVHEHARGEKKTRWRQWAMLNNDNIEWKERTE